jgi:hypothetical protein
MWPLHSRTRPLGHSYTTAGGATQRTHVAVAVADAHAAHADARPSSSSGRLTAAAPRPGPTRRQRWQRRLSSQKFHVLVLALVLLDLCVIVADLALVFTHSIFEPTPAVEEASHALAATSLAILSLFMIEFVAACLAFGPRVWFSEPLHVFDLFVVVASLSLEAALFHLEKQAGLEGLASLLVLGRLWRLARVAVTATEANEAVAEVRGDLHPAKELAALRQEVAALKAQLAEAGLAQRLLPATPSRSPSDPASGGAQEKEEEGQKGGKAAAGSERRGGGNGCRDGAGALTK